MTFWATPAWTSYLHWSLHSHQQLCLSTFSDDVYGCNILAGKCWIKSSYFQPQTFMQEARSTTFRRFAIPTSWGSFQYMYVFQSHESFFICQSFLRMMLFVGCFLIDQHLKVWMKSFRDGSNIWWILHADSENLEIVDVYFIPCLCCFLCESSDSAPCRLGCHTNVW